MSKMLLKTVKLAIDKEKYDPIICKQGDTGRYLLFQLLNNGVPFVLSGKNVRVHAVKKDGSKIYNDLAIIDGPKGICELQLTSQILFFPGWLKLDLTIYEGTDTISLIPFTLDIIASIRDDAAIESTNEFSALSISLSKVDDWNDEFAEKSGKLEELYTPRLNGLSSQLAENAQQQFDIKPQTPMPNKKGISTNSNKILVKDGSDSFKIIQMTNKGYLCYTLNTLQGDSGGASVGGKWDLIRLKKVNQVSDAYLYLKLQPVTGTLTALQNPTVTSAIEMKLFDLSQHNTANTFSSITGNLGIGVYSIDGNNEATFELTTTKNSLANLLYYGSNGSSNGVEIYVNDEKVETINPRGARVSATVGGYSIVEFKVPFDSGISKETYTVKLKNIGTNKFYFSCFNFKKLNEYKNEYIDNYKCFGTSKTWIEATGASDYAIYDTDIGKFCGSYHGGEIRETALLTYNDKLTPVENIPVGFTVESNLKMYQVNNLNNKGKMTSEWDFNIDGTMAMKCGFDGSLRTKNFYTALTCTSPNFQYMSYPTLKKITLNGEEKVFINTGEITQYNSINGIELTIRHTMFDTLYNSKGSYILNNASYSKYYYGAIQDLSNADSKTLNNIRFEKALDFTVR